MRPSYPKHIQAHPAAVIRPHDTVSSSVEGGAQSRVDNKNEWNGAEGTYEMVCWRGETSISTSRQIKYYLEGSGQDRDAVQNVLRGVVRELGDEWMQASINNLGRPS